MKARRLALVAIFIFAVLIPAYVFLGLNLAHVSLTGWMVLAVPFLVLLAFPVLVIWRSLRRGGDSRRLRVSASAVESLVMRFAFVSMGLLSFLLVCTVLRDLLGTATGVWLQTDRVVLLSTAAFAVGYLQAALGPRVKHIKLRCESLPAELRNFRIVQLSDLHISPTIGVRYVKRTVHKVNELLPNFIALTGDIADGNRKDHQETLIQLGGLKATEGVFYVPGNHEYYWDIDEWLQVFRSIGFEVLLNTGKILKFRGKSIGIGGISDPAGAEMGTGAAPSVAAAFQACAHTDFKVLLSHRPAFAQEAAAAGFDLQLSGHTHGGQFLPWTLAIHLFHRYAIGTYRLGKMWLHVSAGTGSWGPFLRLGTTPEITLIELIS
jgi:predicted MPP superfamily phosphohydrolase